MKTFLIIVVAVSILVSGPAQTQTPVLPPAATIKLTAEQTHILKEIVLKDYNFPKSAAAEYKIGDVPPTDTKLESFPDAAVERVSAVRAYKFFLSGENIVVVDPRVNKIAEVID